MAATPVDPRFQIPSRRVVFLALALAALFWFARPVMLPFVVGAIVAYAFSPAIDSLQARTGRSRLLVVVMSYAAGLVVLAAIVFGGFYTPGMALVADRAQRAGLPQGIGFGLTNTAWALGAVTGPAVGGALAEAFGDAVPYLACGALCALTLVAAVRGTPRLRPA